MAQTSYKKDIRINKIIGFNLYFNLIFGTIDTKKYKAVTYTGKVITLNFNYAISNEIVSLFQ